jgi:hypothetical protein
MRALLNSALGWTHRGWTRRPAPVSGDCFEHALTANSRPRIAKPAIIASFCWRDQDDSVVPEIVLLIARFALFWLVDFPIVAILSPPLRLAQSKVIWQESDQHGGY